VIVAAGVDELELAGLVEACCSASMPCEEEAFNLVGRVERVALLRVELVGVALEHAAQVARVRLAVLSMTVPKTSTLPLPKTSAGTQ
jgi:hypothetical protein